jgi:hypothetical protein
VATVTEYLPEPTRELSDPRELFSAYLDYYRDVVVRKLAGLPDAVLRRSTLPSGWTPLQLLKHLVYMERRWLTWSFAGEQVDDPRGDRGSDGEFVLAPEDTFESLKTKLYEQGTRTRALLADADLRAESSVAGGFATYETAVPRLSWILFHVLQEYARHAGHLDIIRELADGQVGE